jgi:hypothetical protein
MFRSKDARLMNKLWLSPLEIEELTGAKTKSKQAKVLTFLGYTYRVRPDASIVVPTEQFLGSEARLATKDYKMDFAALDKTA